MKYIFLDIDGVLNSEEWRLGLRYDGNYLDPICIEQINILCKYTDAKIVLSSSHRLNLEQTKKMLKESGLEPEIFGVTPYFELSSIYPRGAEINAFLAKNPPCTHFVIIDDYNEFDEVQLKHFIKVDPKIGLTTKDTMEAFKILIK